MAVIKIGLDTSAIDTLTRLTCFELGCAHNTNTESTTAPLGYCNYRCVSLGERGACTMYEETPAE
jgi:hypothetical protein